MPQLTGEYEILSIIMENGRIILMVILQVTFYWIKLLKVQRFFDSELSKIPLIISEDFSGNFASEQ